MVLLTSSIYPFTNLRISTTFICVLNVPLCVYYATPIANIYYDRQTQQCFFINLLFYKLQDVFMTTCFGLRMAIIRSTRAIMYMFLLGNDILL